MLKNLVSIPIERLVPDVEMFAHRSDIHGQQHVARVVILGFLLLERLNLHAESARFWAAAYLHDLGRRHDGRCLKHGGYAIERLHEMPEVRDLFSLAGVLEHDYEAIKVAAKWHSLNEELPPEHSHWRLTALLKDADGLDRVRLGDLNPEYLRFQTSRDLIGFAKKLHDTTQWDIATGPAYMAGVWPVAVRLAESHLVEKSQRAL